MGHSLRLLRIIRIILGESFGVDFEIPAGGFCFLAFSFTGVGSDVGSHGREQSPSGASAKATSSLSSPSFRTSGDDDESAGSTGPAPRFISASTEGILGASSRRTSSMRRYLFSFCFSQSGFSLLDLPR